jgi:hypothetical protein
MLHYHVWIDEAELPLNRIACIKCVERRIHRKLTVKDFTDCPLNWSQGYCDKTSTDLDHSHPRVEARWRRWEQRHPELQITSPATQ